MKWLFLLSHLVVLLVAEKQTVKVKGTVTCDIWYYSRATVQLWEHDTLYPDDLLALAAVSKIGFFELTGSTEEFLPIEPYLLIKHKCHVKNKNCTRHSHYPIPKKYIGSEEAYDMGYVNVAISVSPHDKEQC